MMGCKFQFVFIFVVKVDAVLVDEAHDGGLPAGRTQEANDAVEDPVLLFR